MDAMSWIVIILLIGGVGWTLCYLGKKTLEINNAPSKKGNQEGKSRSFGTNAIKIAMYHKKMNVAFLLMFLTNAFFQSGTNTDQSAALAMNAFGAIICLPLAIVFIYCATRLAIAIGGRYRFVPICIVAITLLSFVISYLGADVTTGILRALLAFMLSAIVAVGIISIKSRNILKAEGMKIGLLGAKEISWLGYVKGISKSDGKKMSSQPALVHVSAKAKGNYCSNCGKEIHPQWKFCQSCGNQLH